MIQCMPWTAAGKGKDLKPRVNAINLPKCVNVR